MIAIRSRSFNYYNALLKLIYKRPNVIFIVSLGYGRREEQDNLIDLNCTIIYLLYRSATAFRDLRLYAVSKSRSLVART